MEIIDRLDPDLPPIYTDKIQLGRVFNNLISNTIVHNPRGTQIEISAEVICDRGDRWIRCTILMLQWMVAASFGLPSRLFQTKRVLNVKVTEYLSG
jgi:signal transduction histidine kinase